MESHVIKAEPIEQKENAEKKVEVILCKSETTTTTSQTNITTKKIPFKKYKMISKHKNL